MSNNQNDDVVRNDVPGHPLCHPRLPEEPGVTAVTVLSLALAIGATTAVFSLVNAVLLRALPYRDAGRIVMLWTTNALNGALEQNTSLPNLRDWKARSRAFEDMAAYREFDGPLMKPGNPASKPTG